MEFKVNSGSKVKRWPEESGVQGKKKVNSQSMGKVEENAQLSPERIRCLHDMKIKHMALIRPEIETHWDRVDAQKDTMTQIEELIKRREEQKCQDLDTQLKFKEFEVPEIHDHQKFKHVRQEIHHKLEKYEQIKRKTNEDGMKIRHLIDKTESLYEEATEIKIFMEECNTMIKSQSEEFQLMEQCNMIESQKTEVRQTTEEFKYPGNANDLVDHMNKITGIGVASKRALQVFREWRKFFAAGEK